MRKIFALLAVVVIAGCISGEAVHKLNFADMEISFRADLRQAEKISLEPGPEAIRQVMFENPVTLVRLAFVPDEQNTGFYGVTGYELIAKTGLAYKQYIFTDESFYLAEGSNSCIIFEKTTAGITTQRKICFETLLLNETSEAFAFANETAPVILMEAGASETKVSVDGNVVSIMGKDMSQQGRAYTDLDLAADKFLLVLLTESVKRHE